MFPNTEKVVCTKLLLMVLFVIVKMETCTTVQISTFKWKNIVIRCIRSYLIALNIFVIAPESKMSKMHDIY